MDRRNAIRLLGLAGLGAMSTESLRGQTLAPYTVGGAGPVLIAFDRGTGHYDQLIERYRVVVIDYPPAEIRDATTASVIGSFTPDRVCKDVLAVADAVGADRFAYYGFSWGGVVGLQLATRTDRLSALVCGGWPPLGAPYKDMANAAAGQPIYKTFYEHLTDWPERAAVSEIGCPRLTFAGREDVITTTAVTARIGPLIAEHRDELERLGWRVRLVDGFKHELGFRPDVAMPLVREFLDSVLPRAGGL
jgi:pimeloyl-ACP methyl ester carboxylesterase